MFLFLSLFCSLNLTLSLCVPTSYMLSLLYFRRPLKILVFQFCSCDKKCFLLEIANAAFGKGVYAWTDAYTQVNYFMGEVKRTHRNEMEPPVLLGARTGRRHNLEDDCDY